MTDTDTDTLLEAVRTLTSRQSIKAFRRMPPADAVDLVGQIAKTVTIVFSNLAMRQPSHDNADATQEAAIVLDRIAPAVRAVAEAHHLACKTMSRLVCGSGNFHGVVLSENAKKGDIS
ncbi:hypothetical protein [Acidiferrobacter sp.]